MLNNSRAVHPTKPILSTADFNKEFAPDPASRAANLSLAQLLHAGEREASQLWPSFDINIFLEEVEDNFILTQIVTIYNNAVAFKQELKEQVDSIDSDPEAHARHYSHETDQVHNGVGMETVRSEYVPNDEMSQILGDLETFEIIAAKLQEHFDLKNYLVPQTA